MCGRFTLTKPRSLHAAEAFAELLASSPEARAVLEQLEPRFNIAPSQDVLVLPNTDDGLPQLLRWGLIPSWAKDEKIGYRTINARAESVASKPAFRQALVERRCLIPADGFYEWQGKGKQPFYVRRRDGEPFALAGLWEVWRPDGRDPVSSCTIITTQPNALLAPIHQRMPVLLPPKYFAAWLDPAPRADRDQLVRLLVPHPPDELEAFRVGRLVNAAAEDRPECILPEQDLSRERDERREEADEPPRKKAVQQGLFD